ncbi:glutamyl-tRNA reductase binding protein [Haematococcus lacustris]
MRCHPGAPAHQRFSSQPRQLPSCQRSVRLRPFRVTAGTHNGTAACTAPSPAETARTVVDICQDGILSTIASDGSPIGTPVAFHLDKAGHPCLRLADGSLELQNLARDGRCSLQVQPTALPARAVASVTLVGRLQPAAHQDAHVLEVNTCLYFGGLDQSGVSVSGEEFRAAEPDVLRRHADELIRTWNDERAEDIYRIVSHHLGIPLTEMSYAELLWLDRLGMYVRTEAAGHLAGTTVVRVPFYRAVLDERDARSVLTMAAQVSWERERPYTPPVPSIFTDAAAASNN